MTAVIERASPTDLMELAADSGAVPMQVGAVLILDSGSGFDLTAAEGLIADRIRAVPRLRQRLVRVPLGCGRPVWVDDRDFDIRRHTRRVACPPPGNEQALLDAATALAITPLSRRHPLWSATFVTGLEAGKAALVVVFHHVLADGIGGLAVLANLVDGLPTPRHANLPRDRPSNWSLAVDAWLGRLRALSRLPSGWRRVRQAGAELGVRRPARASPCSLNRPTGGRRRLAVVRADLAGLHDVAHQHGGTVNDAVLTAITGALDTLLEHRGETVDNLVVSVPVSARRSANASHLGNEVGAMPVALPTGGDPFQRLEQIAAITRTRKISAPGMSSVVLGAAFRALAALRILQWFIDRQRLVHTFVTNLRGPDQRLTFNGATVSDVIPVSGAFGNVTVAFGVLSYAGTLVITVISDPDRVRDLPVLVAALDSGLDTLTSGHG